MKKFIVCITLVLVSSLSNAQEKTTPSNWKKSGTVTFLFNQSSFSNWVAGGENTVAGTLGFNYNFNYASGDWKWENKLMASYGINNVSGEGSKKTDDMFEFNSLVAKNASAYWSYSFFLNLRSQFTTGYDYKAVPRVETSDFFSPGYITFGPGMFYKKSDNFTINLSPATSKLTLVNDMFSGQYGTEPGSNSRYEIGFYGAVYYKLTLMENVTIENIFNAYSNYLEEAKNIDINYQVNILMKINKYLSTNLSFHTIIDDNAISRVQFKEVFGLGVNYSF